MPESDTIPTKDAQLESILFVASGPTPPHRLCKALDISPADLANVVARLSSRCQGSGLSVQQDAAGIQLTTAAECAPVVEEFLGIEEMRAKVTPAALEVLAVIAFLQPATRPRIDEIRGVGSESSLKTLLSLGLVNEIGRLETPGRPILYGTTPEFLQYLGISSLEELPPLRTVDELLDQVGLFQGDSAYGPAAGADSEGIENG